VDRGGGDGVLQRRLAVVHVAHESDHRRPLLEVGRIVLGPRFGRCGRNRSRFRHNADFKLEPVVGAELAGVRLADRLVDSGEFAELDEVGDEFVRFLAYRFGQRLDDDRSGQRDFAARCIRRRSRAGRSRVAAHSALVRISAASALELFLAPPGGLFGRFLHRFFVVDHRFAFLVVEIGEIRLHQFDHVSRNDAVFGVIRFDALGLEFFDHGFGRYPVLFCNVFDNQHFVQFSIPPVAAALTRQGVQTHG